MYNGSIHLFLWTAQLIQNVFKKKLLMLFFELKSMRYPPVLLVSSHKEDFSVKKGENKSFWIYLGSWERIVLDELEPFFFFSVVLLHSSPSSLIHLFRRTLQHYFMLTHWCSKYHCAASYPLAVCMLWSMAVTHLFYRTISPILSL